ncbi:CDP-alcohol phosphatidyltransferase-domain-containing protein [Umbelopsis sp. AD052]|nr:CDP-alcohol phosphatidyltransferase-domain-containing protein [Umbelopsis sp. AD052]
MSGMLTSEFIPKAQLENLKLYKYAAVDKSFTSKYILSHYWSWAIELFPLWMAPNLITLTGLMFMVSNVILAAVYVPGMDEEGGPRWVYVSFAIGLWLYSTFDNVDGKQARRTGSSSPLGELFDHGCDALNCSFAAVLQATTLGLGHSHMSVLLYGVAAIGFYLSTAEEYHTGVLYLGYVNAPTEGVILSCVVMLVTGFYGPSIWHMPLEQSIVKQWVPSFVPSDMRVADMIVWQIVLLFVFTHVPVCYYAMYKACKAKNKPFLSAVIVESLPIAIYSISGYFWVMSPYSTLLSEKHFILFAITTGIVFGRIASKIILAHLVKVGFPMFTVMLLPLIGGAIIANAPVLFDTEPIFTPESEYMYLCAYFVFALVAYTHWALVVIRSFCSFLGINCLTIPHGKNAANGKPKAA